MNAKVWHGTTLENVMTKGGTFTTTVPCQITYNWHPEERETQSEPGVDEEFEVVSMEVAGMEVVTPVSSFFGDDFEDIVKEYLKEHYKDMQS